MSGNECEFRGYSLSRRLLDVVRSYEERLGVIPTLIAVPTVYEIPVDFDVCRAVHSSCIAMILATHFITDWHEPGGDANMTASHAKVPLNMSHVEVSTLPKVSTSGKRRHINLNGDIECCCPHCKQAIKSFEALGFWHGWEIGKAPPYWEELRAYVWQRDGKSCVRCNKAVTLHQFNCHHIHPKERAGTDSARNLITLCTNCHDYIHGTAFDKLDQADQILTKNL